MKRRDFVTSAGLTLAGATLSRGLSDVAAQKRADVMTVRGRIPADGIGVTLMHEHLLVDFVGADKVSPKRYDQSEVFRVALPHLKRAAELGCRTFVDCTPAYLGRDAWLLQRFSRAAGINVITTTGYYGAANDKFVPAHAYRESAEQLAARWTREFAEGIDGTKIKPGVIKIGVDAGPLSAIDAKLVRAAALTHLRTGLTICSHTGDSTAAFEQLDLISKLGVNAQAFVWVHAQSEKNAELHARAAERGCWVEFDGISDSSAARHLDLVKNMNARGHLDKTLISMDAGWYHVGEPGGGKFRSYESVFTEFLPGLRANLNETQVKQLLVNNPQKALALGVRGNLTRMDRTKP